MNTGLKIFLIIFAFFAGIALLRRLFRRGGGKAFILSALQGLAALFAVNITASITGINIPLNPFSALTVTLLGLPGTAGLLFLQHIFR